MALHIFFFQICVAIIALPIHILAFLGLWDPIAKKGLPYLLERVTKNYNKLMKEHKKELFSNLNDFKGPSGELKVLELGCGTGANFQFYPPGCSVTCVDPNPNFKSFLNKSLAENQHIHFQDFLIAPGENMAQIKSGSMDVVICTLVLCSVKNIEDILAEIRRVLRPVSVTLAPDHASLERCDTDMTLVDNSHLPCEDSNDRTMGGAFYFLEHVRADPSSWTYFFQSILDPTWKYIGDGCQLRRETWINLEKAKFSEITLRHITAPFKYSPVKPHIIGYALK